MAYINYRKNNPYYSPGISTYTANGEQGDTGANGKAIYYTDSVLKDNADAVSEVENKINNGQCLCSSDSTESSITYQEYDIIIDGIGDMYYIIQNNATLKVGDCIGSIRNGILKTFSYKSATSIQILYEITSYVYYALDDNMCFDCSISNTIGTYTVPSTTKYIEVCDKDSGAVGVFKFEQ